jgi:hypothetical protein
MDPKGKSKTNQTGQTSQTSRTSQIWKTSKAIKTYKMSKTSKPYLTNKTKSEITLKFPRYKKHTNIMSVCLSVSLSVSLSLCLSVYLSLCLFVSLSLFMSLSLSLCHSLSIHRKKKIMKCFTSFLWHICRKWQLGNMVWVYKLHPGMWRRSSIPIQSLRQSGTFKWRGELYRIILWDSRMQPSGMSW